MSSLPSWCSDPEYLPSTGELYSLSIDDRDTFISHNPLGTAFQFLNQEYVDSFVEELLCKIKKINQKEIKILEVGAGNGRLTYFLKREILKKGVKEKIDFIASDDYSWHKESFPYMWVKHIDSMNVENINAEESIRKYNPDIVISSWMPHKNDWTPYFRQNQNTKSYVLIGYPRECGTRESWSEQDGFKGKELLLQGNMSWKDGFYECSTKYSKIVLFSRHSTD